LDLAPKFNDYLNGVIARWEQQNPRYDVVWTDVPWGSVERKLLAAVFARTAPDVVNLNPLFAANLASKGGLQPLEPLLPQGAAETYLPLIWQAGQSAAPDGQSQQFAIPWYLTARITLANSQLLSQAGYEAPPRSWAEVPAYAEAVKRRTGRYALFVTVVPEDSAELLESLVQMGVTLLDERQRAAGPLPSGVISIAAACCPARWSARATGARLSSTKAVSWPRWAAVLSSCAASRPMRPRWPRPPVPIRP